MESGLLLPELMDREEFPIEWRFSSLNTTTERRWFMKLLSEKVHVQSDSYSLSMIGVFRKRNMKA